MADDRAHTPMLSRGVLLPEMALSLDDVCDVEFDARSVVDVRRVLGMASDVDVPILEVTDDATVITMRDPCVYGVVNAALLLFAFTSRTGNALLVGWDINEQCVIDTLPAAHWKANDGAALRDLFRNETLD
jgi:hypothetical protein